MVYDAPLEKGTFAQRLKKIKKVIDEKPSKYLKIHK